MATVEPIGTDVTPLLDREVLCSPEELMDMFGISYAEARFVTFYVENPTNASNAARHAGFSKVSAHSIASDLMRRHDVAAAIAYEMNKLQERTRISQDRILHELAILAFSNVTDFIVNDLGQLSVREGVPEYALRAVQSVKRKITRHTNPETGSIVEYVELEIKLWNKTEALRLAGTHYGMFSLNVNVKGKVSHEHTHKQVWEIGGRRLLFS